MRHKKDAVLAQAVFLFLFLVFAATSAPTISWWDSSEFVAAASCWGIPHPPGSPLYVTLSRVFCAFADDAASTARCVNFLSVTATAGAGVFLFLSLKKIFGTGSIFKKYVLASAAVCGMMGFSVWDSAVEAEVYGLSTLAVFALLWMSLKTAEGKPRYFLAASYLIALSFSIHATAMIASIPVAAAFVLSEAKKRTKVIIFAVSLLCASLGASSYMILYFRALEKPALNESSVESFSDLADVALRRQYGSRSLLERSTSSLTGYGFMKGLFYQNVSYVNYMSWQFTPFVREGKFGAAGMALTSLFMTVFVLLFLYSLFRAFREKSKKNLAVFLLFMLCLSLVLVFVFNFKFCSSDTDPSHLPKEARPRDYFFSAGFALIYAFSLCSLIYVKRKIALTLTLIFTAAGLYNGFTGHANRRGNWTAHAFAMNVLESTSGKSVIMLQGDNDTFTLWFAQIVGGIRNYDPVSDTGTIVINRTLLNLPWYMDEISERIPFELSKVYGDLFDEIDLEGKDVEDFCRNNALAVKNGDGRILYPGDVAARCILAEISGIDYDLSVIALSDSDFSEVIRKNGKMSCRLYSTSGFSELEGLWVREGLLQRAFGDSSENRRLLLGYDYRGIINSQHLDENGRLESFRTPALSAAFERDIDSRAMSVFYAAAVEALDPSDSLFWALSPVFLGGERGVSDESHE